MNGRIRGVSIGLDKLSKSGWFEGELGWQVESLVCDCDGEGKLCRILLGQDSKDTNLKRRYSS